MAGVEMTKQNNITNYHFDIVHDITVWILFCDDKKCGEFDFLVEAVFYDNGCLVKPKAHKEGLRNRRYIFFNNYGEIVFDVYRKIDDNHKFIEKITVLEDDDGSVKLLTTNSNGTTTSTTYNTGANAETIDGQISLF